MWFDPGIMPGHCLKGLRDPMANIVLKQVTAKKHCQEHSHSRQRYIIDDPVPEIAESVPKPMLDESYKSLHHALTYIPIPLMTPKVRDLN